MACSYYLEAQQNFDDSLPAGAAAAVGAVVVVVGVAVDVAVATNIVVLVSVAMPLVAFDIDPFDVLAASFAWN